MNTVLPSYPNQRIVVVWEWGWYAPPVPLPHLVATLLSVFRT